MHTGDRISTTTLFKNSIVSSGVRLNSVYFLSGRIRKVSQFKALEKQTYARMFSATKKGMENQCSVSRTNLNLTWSCSLEKLVAILVSKLFVGSTKDKTAPTTVDLAEEKKQVLVKRLRLVFNSPWYLFLFGICFWYLFGILFLSAYCFVCWFSLVFVSVWRHITLGFVLRKLVQEKKCVRCWSLAISRMHGFISTAGASQACDCVLYTESYPSNQYLINIIIKVIIVIINITIGFVERVSICSRL